MNKIITISNILTYITFLSELVPLIFCLLFFKKTKAKGLRVFFIYCIFLSIFSVLGSFTLFNQSSKYNYFIVVRLYTIVEYALFSILLSKFIYGLKVKKVLVLSIIPFFTFATLNWFLYKDTFSEYPLLIEFIFFILAIIYFFYEKMKSSSLLPIYNSIHFWICVGLFVYFTGNFFYILLVEYSTQASAEVKNQLKLIYSVVTITKNLLLGLSLLASEKTVIEENETMMNFSNEYDSEKIILQNNSN